jgi:hypothetical protein
MSGSRPKKVEFYVNENGCHICTSHSKDKNGYCYYRIDKKTGKLHRKIYMDNHGPIPKGMLIRHTCDTPSCINPKHLLLGTILDNARDMVDRNRQAKGEAAGAAVLTEAQVIEIIADENSFYEELARKYNVTASTIQGIRRGDTWKHLARPNGVEGPRDVLKGEKHAQAKLTKEQVVEIIENNTLTHQELGNLYNVSSALITRIKTGKCWKHINRDNLKIRDNKGESNTNSKLKEADVEYILKDKDTPDRKLAAMFNICSSTVRTIKAGKKWKHIPRPT